MSRTCTPVPAKKGEENLTDAQRAFLAAFREMGIIRRACKVAEGGRQTHYDWIDASPEYREAFEAAKGTRQSSVGVGAGAESPVLKPTNPLYRPGTETP